MDFIQTIVLALIQGISEFLPISSSAHLILVPKLSDWPDQGLAFDVVVHMGTLVAVIYYYKHIISQLFSDFYLCIIERKVVGESKLAWGVLLGTIPVGIFGFLFEDFIANDLRSVEIITYTTIVFGILLGVAVLLDTKSPRARELLAWRDVVFIGVMQTLALVPGVSRSGITITAGLLIGLSRKATVQFSFLLSIPVITLSVLLILIDIYQQQQVVNLTLLVVGFVVSSISAYLTIIFFIRALNTMSMMPFVVYRLFLGVFLLML
ncbi:Undecaprenyl-diphosphatase (EC 3.6.1.27) [uncultured Gammaproteobacteria bacterium]|nr:Undecaprenyl-diphosphatase (EC 3.6.1.27) [uncultured Gammaproteobacteria bacterium]CAC9591628.1 Undecaprenyl-diphosphatase (EC 3.6.1.27) [uncultured Gammaproteobacteria bacterium]CAC9646279.1 Undecaprenyl-diphosphatase (EC 3.6.1.27) [uncultured Gammaproteobacteria bacterium]CAC9652998.1 Undecaprenyl-diphosphatase (EC 3.6.1.27) [uncultured Gammaproteobacteria bacterium]CAC9653018.1 Undecaprenyl-diphosphatase (EC 3.6.1.27) [uncultured Gammaproteobacteria bacterium]